METVPDLKDGGRLGQRVAVEGVHVGSEVVHELLCRQRLSVDALRHQPVRREHQRDKLPQACPELGAEI